jgi:GTP-binding protein
MFVDEVKIYARAGHGGRGCVAFLRETFRPKGGPCGGNGGRGGDVILEADHDLNNLVHQFYQPRLIAEDGGHGLGKGMDGRAGRDLVVKVPCGTLVWALARPAEPPAEAPATPAAATPARLPVSGARRPRLRVTGDARAVEINLETDPEPEPAGGHERGRLLADLTRPGQRFVLCKGGRGGLGNRNFATARRQTPRFAQPGEPGEEGEFLLELRLMADVGLVGFPNAGKSTLLAAVSKARPKIAPYPFTTLHPQVGIVEYPDWYRLTLCDVPGLVAGAHRNVGLGHAFLRHIRRCRVLVLVLDMAGTDNRAPWEDYQQLLTELELYDPALLERPRLVVANKMDEAAAAANLRRFRRRVPGVPLLRMAAAFDEGLAEFKQAIRRAVEAAGPAAAAGPDAA